MADPLPPGTRAGQSPFEDNADMTSKTKAAKLSPPEPAAPSPSDAPMRIALNWAVLIGGMAALMYVSNFLLKSL